MNTAFEIKVVLNGDVCFHQDLDVLSNDVRRVVTKYLLSSRAECLNGPFSVNRNDTNGTGFNNLRYSLLTEREIALYLPQVFILREELGLIALNFGDIRDDPDQSSAADWRRPDFNRSTCRGT